MARLLNSQCDFKNGFFTCDLPEDAILLILKVKTQTGNHTLVEDMEKQTEKFWPWKKQVKDRKQVPEKLPGVLTPRKNDNSVTSDSGPCPSPTEHEYKPRFFEANVARNLKTLCRASSPYPRKNKYFRRFGTGHGW